MRPKQSILAEATPGSKAVSFIGLWLFSFGIFNLIGAGLLGLKFGFSAVESLPKAAELHPELINWVKLVQTIVSIGAFVIPALAFSYLNERNWFSFSTLNKSPKVGPLLLSVVVILTAAPGIMWVLYVNQNISFPESMVVLENWLKGMEKSAEALMLLIIKMDSPIDLAINIFVIAMIPAIGEEILFRGTLQKILQNVWNDPHKAIFISGFIFSCFHLQFYGFFPRFFLGVLFGYLFWWSGKIWIPIFAHFVHNGLQVILIYLNDHGHIATDIETVETLPWPTVVVGTVLLALSLWWFHRITQAKSVGISSSDQSLE